MEKNYNLTTKQFQLMDVIVKGNGESGHCDMDQLLERLESEHNWKTTKESLQFSIRALRAKGFIRKDGKEKRRGRLRMVIAPTIEGYKVFGTNTAKQTSPSSDLQELATQLKQGGKSDAQFAQEYSNVPEMEIPQDISLGEIEDFSADHSEFEEGFSAEDISLFSVE